MAELRSQLARPGTPTAEISTEIVRMFARYFGRGPTKAQTTVTPDACMVSMADCMTRAEQNLVLLGQLESVRATRRTLQEAMRDEAIAAIENALRRKVVAYMSDIDVCANMAAVVFILGPK